ncbi:FecR domain-containing protein [Sphingobacterium sp. 2149]|uniref:FecR family protein n=1 Tax=Sphingobacterium sp. 2149 TaxID=2817763 RepID=UPI00285A690D|nr:FecR domain-containing protein [Sphingobacterium sp. 2149]MDR6733505.1 ferric-dicitrate binding protein FerR (iron transport regulator) [Sphingobacterium sp. 2149]
MDESQDPQYIQLLARKWQENRITNEERAIFEKWYNETENVLEITSDESRTEMEQRIYKQILHRAGIRARRVISYRHVAAAASLVFMLCFGAYFLFYNKLSESPVPVASSTVIPGSNKAILRLADGRAILLDGTANGKLAQQGNTIVTKDADGQLRYAQGNDHEDAKYTWNTLETPFGGQYQLLLADGTKVWLNAGSSITYPTIFDQKERKVEIRGEVYFEVSHHADWPFKVSSPGQTVEVLGTQFNVNAYDNEAQTRTSLLQGAVQVLTAHAKSRLSPGQQAIYDGNKLITSIVDTDEAIAWKQGYFRFNDEGIESIMRQLARWYNVEVKFEGKITKESFSGKISRQKSIQQTLAMLENTGTLHFKIEGRRVTVMQ